MNFIELVELANQTLVIVPRFAGQVLRLGSLEVVAVANGTPIRVFGTGAAEVSEGWWDLATVVDGEYLGPPFSGSTTAPGETERYRWTGPENSSPSAFETRTVSGSQTPLNLLSSGPWIGGQGHSGCRFANTPSYVTNSGYAGGRIGFAASFTEVGDWVFG